MAAPGPGRGLPMSRPKWMEEAEASAREKAKRAGREDAEAPLVGPLAVIDAPPGGGSGGGAGPVVWAGTGNGRVAVRLGALGGRGGDQHVLAPVGAAPGEISGSCCRVQGPGVSGGIAGGAVFAQLHAHDGSGQRIYDGSANVSCRAFLATGPPGGAPAGPPVVATVKDNEDGTYMLTYSVKAAGEYRVHVEVNGDALPGSPFPVMFREPPAIARPADHVPPANKAVLERAAAAAAKVAEGLADQVGIKSSPPDQPPAQGASPDLKAGAPGVVDRVKLQELATRIDEKAKEAAAARAAANINSRLEAEERDSERRHERDEREHRQNDRQLMREHDGRRSDSHGNRRADGEGGPHYRRSRSRSPRRG